VCVCLCVCCPFLFVCVPSILRFYLLLCLCVCVCVCFCQLVFLSCLTAYSFVVCLSVCQYLCLSFFLSFFVVIIHLSRNSTIYKHKLSFLYLQMNPTHPTQADWSVFIAPFWKAVFMSALKPKNFLRMLQSGFTTVKGFIATVR
jgi:glucan phosphoethanolaminetransferase (alkaline phosphatase superfamily)